MRPRSRTLFRTCGILALVLAAPLLAHEWQAQSEEEALFLRRIADFWKEGEYQIVKSQIEEFLREYPESSFAQTLHATLGDLYVRDGNFKGALMQYSRIVDPAIADKIFLNRMQCLLELQWFATLADECEAYLQQELSADHKQRATHLLAISLYQQCLNSSNDPEVLQRLASRALPYFQELLQGSLSEEIDQATAHLCSILQKYPDAAEIFLQLSTAAGSNREEMLFQAALFQAKFDKPLALNTFRSLADAGKSRASDAAFNALVLSYECNEFEEILAKKEETLARIPPESGADARLFFGKCYLHLKQYESALQELLAFTLNKEPSDALKSALVDIMDVSYRLENSAALEGALDRFAALYPQDPELVKGRLSQALLEKKFCHHSCARTLFKKIQSEFPESIERQIAFFEEIHLDFHESRWLECRENCIAFVHRYPDSERAPFAWRFFASSSANLCISSPTQEVKEQLVADLTALLAQNEVLKEEEKVDWIFLQAKTCYDLKWHSDAAALLETLPPSGNSRLLLALSYRDGLQDMRRFCIEAEEALSLGADLLPRPAIHLALFNGYLEQERFEPAADHLYLAAQELPILPGNLLWMADYYDGENLHLDRAAFALERFFSASGIDANKIEEESLVFEKAFLKLADLYGRIGKPEEQIALLESLKQQREANSSWNWQEGNTVDLRLGELYETRGQSEQALCLYDRLTAKAGAFRNYTSAAAALKGARLRLAKLDVLPKMEVVKLLSLLKTLSLQKNLSNEPIHLEAALEYIDLQTRLEAEPTRLQKRLSLLLRAKENFEGQEDPLSKDYHAGREQSKEKEDLYRGYLNFFEAEILYCKSTLTQEGEERSLLLQNAKKLYEEILLNPPSAYLAGRAKRQLEQIKQ